MKFPDNSILNFPDISLMRMNAAGRGGGEGGGGGFNTNKRSNGQERDITLPMFY